jgi:hypothetical protein
VKVWVRYGGTAAGALLLAVLVLANETRGALDLAWEDVVGEGYT